ncbi:hypothetical protein F5Y08DRAFT_270953 [Xylaria arbuscula]|nr:hypothetical protein F5Y08DRAFT_270953 [Xylaria arbuscula]
MELEKNLPQTLVRVMNNNVELSTYDEWRTSNGAVSISSSLATSATYDAQRSLWHHAGSQKDFEGAINDYFQHTKYEVNSKWSTWEGVLEQLDSATTIYDQKTRGNPARAMMRKGQALSRDLILLLEALPNDNGLGLLKGGLLVIFHAVKRRSEACEKVFHCFRLVPEMISRVHKLEGLFHRDKGVKARVDDFYSSLTTSIPRLIRILNRNETENRVVRVGKLILGDQVKDVNACIEPVTEALEKLDECVHSLERYRDAQTARKLDNIQSSQSFVRSNVSELRKEQKDGFNEVIEAIREEHAAIREPQLKELADKAALMILNNLYQMGAERYRPKDLDDGGTARHAPREAFPTLPHAQTAEVRGSSAMQPTLGGLLEALGGKSVCLESEKDHAEIIRKCHQFSDKALRQAAFLKSTPRFHRWLSGTAPEVLLVDGHDTRGRISAMSVFCAMLVQALWKIQEQHATPQAQSFVLFFTCGAHIEPEDILAGPCGIVRSLIGQLLVSWPTHGPDLSFTDDVDSLLFAVQENSIDALCYLFQELLRQLPPESVVYCIIDGVSMYETSYLNRKDDMDSLVEVFRDLTSVFPIHEAPGPVIKVLLASADKSTDVYRLLPSENRVDLRAQNQVSSTPTERSLLGDIQRTLQPEG